MQTEVEGIILKETLYGETSKVIQVLTKEYGLIGIIAKGASSLKSNLRSLTLPFLYAKFKINYKKDKLSVLTGGEIIRLYCSNKSNLKLYAYVNYLCELSYLVLKENNDTKIFDILKSGLEKLESGLNYEVIKNIIEFKYLDFLGIRPDFDICQKCYSRDNLIAVDGKIGGYVCSNCYQNERKVDSKFVKILKRYQDVDMNEIKDIKIDDENQKIISEFIEDYYETFSAIYTNSKNFLNAVK